MDPLSSVILFFEVLRTMRDLTESVTGKGWFRDRPVKRLKKWIGRQEGDLHIDIYSYTGETMYEPVFLALQLALQEERLKSKTVRIRILLRDCDYPFVLRNRERNPDYKLYDERVRKKADAAIEQWKGMPGKLDGNIIVTTKTYRFEPSFKAVMINGCRGYFGFYKIDPEHVKNVGGRKIVAPDYVAADTSLVPLDNPKDKTRRMLLDSFKSWFDRTWDDFSDSF